MLIKNIDNIIFRLGKNAKENFELIDCASKDDYWFHIDDEPSGHCIVAHNIMTKEIIITASLMVKENSKFKDKKNVKIIYTQISNIKKTKILGQVIILNNSIVKKISI